ncbi:hypothetical protein Dsin_028543 [Dipteronia sinensis]|uniref:Uncharacterized protein n=1 Tax=Dipteronia sinensis TaxID=43782 RepID=A0AAE0DVN2_9ROSI|nr:hypothetical protein Dsin_028543 [Dipteronia sinensis]
MVQMLLLWWPKSTTTTTTTTNGSCCCITAGSSSATTTSTTSSSSCVSKLVRKVKKQCRSLRATAVGRRQRSFECRYDPLSYSLNFDTSGCGNMLEDEDYYYHFCAFSSRYVANNPTTSSSPKIKIVSASH